MKADIDVDLVVPMRKKVYVILSYVDGGAEIQSVFSSKGLAKNSLRSRNSNIWNDSPKPYDYPIVDYTTNGRYYLEEHELKP